MKYFLIAGEASGDLHAARLMEALKQEDVAAEFRYYGGDAMQAVAPGLLRHYKEIAYMGFLPVLRHLPTILQAMRQCRGAVEEWQPDVLILVDYPGFNLSIAKYIHQHTRIPVFYYILPKVWAWKEGRVKAIRENTDERFSILPFEQAFFEEKHHCPIHYIGNPSVDEISTFKEQYHQTFAEFCLANSLSQKPFIALLPGSRLQEIKDNLRNMVEGAAGFAARGYGLVIAGAPAIPDEYYRLMLAGLPAGKMPVLLRDKTLEILFHAEAAVVTSGTATLETALMGVPQVVCYYAPLGRLVRAVKPHFLKVKYISLINLILDEELVPELIGDHMQPRLIRHHLEQMLIGGGRRAEVLKGYDQMCGRLGTAGAPKRAAALMKKLLSRI